MASLTPPLEFCCPPWYRDFDNREERFPGEICWYHDDICEEVEYDMRLLRRQSQLQTEEEEEDCRLEEEDCRLEEEEEEEDCRLEEEEEEDCRLDLASLDTSPTGFRSDVAYRHVEVWTFKMDKPYNISLLLSGTNRDYLVNNKGDKVNVGELSGKYVMIYFWSLPDHGHTHYKPNPEFNTDLEEIYKIHREEFEIVLVALGNNEDAFRETFSHIPWLAIPHEDQQARNFFITEFAIPHPTYERAVLFSLDSTVLVANAEPTISSYGAHAFPFTKEMIDILLGECHALQYELFVNEKMPPLTELLGANVISRDGKKASEFYFLGRLVISLYTLLLWLISHSSHDLLCFSIPVYNFCFAGTSNFENKTLGLYFFEPTSQGIQRTRQLLKIWKSLNDNQRDAFVIVLISKDPFCLSIAMEELKKKFRYPIPWYSVEGCGRKLCRVFRKECGSETDKAGDLIVLKPDTYQPLSYFAFNILVKYGSDAYPFTLERAVELAKREQQNQLVLGELLSPEAPLRRGSSACYKEDSDTTVSKLFGKRILLLFATHFCYEAGSFLPELKRMYEKKGTDDDFEIIYISLDCDQSPSSFPKSIQGMPWLVHSFVPDFAFALAQQVFDVFPPRLPAIAAFGTDGYLVTKESNLTFKNNGNSEYPFIKADMDEEVSRELIYRYKWDLGSLAGFFNN